MPLCFFALQGVKYTCEITGSPATLVCSECPVYFATYDAQHETMGDNWKKHPNKLVFVRKFQKVLGTWCVCTIHLDPLGTFQSEFQNQDLEAIGTLVVFASPWNYVCNMFIVLLFSVGTCFEIDFIDKCLAIEPSPKLDYSVLGLEPMGVNCKLFWPNAQWNIVSFVPYWKQQKDWH